MQIERRLQQPAQNVQIVRLVPEQNRLCYAAGTYHHAANLTDSYRYHTTARCTAGRYQIR